MAACPNPAAAEIIARLTASRQVVRGHRLRTPRPVISTGLSALDAFLPFGGYPADGITELMGDGTRHVLACLALSHHSRSGQVAFLSSSFIPNPALLEAFGGELSHCHFLVEEDETLLAWSLLQVVASGLFGLVVLYGSRFPGREPLLDATACRRLFGLVREYSVPFLLLLDSHASLPGLVRPCSLRLEVLHTASPESARVQILKISGSSPGAALTVLLRAAPLSERHLGTVCGVAPSPPHCDVAQATPHSAGSVAPGIRHQSGAQGRPSLPCHRASTISPALFSGEAET
jgi:hypothetical protein